MIISKVNCIYTHNQSSLQLQFCNISRGNLSLLNKCILSQETLSFSTFKTFQILLLWELSKNVFKSVQSCSVAMQINITVICKINNISHSMFYLLCHNYTTLCSSHWISFLPIPSTWLGPHLLPIALRLEKLVTSQDYEQTVNGMNNRKLAKNVKRALKARKQFIY